MLEALNRIRAFGVRDLKSKACDGSFILASLYGLKCMRDVIRMRPFDFCFYPYMPFSCV